MMYPSYFNSMMFGNVGYGLPLFVPALIIPLIAWSLVWKGLALWRAARRGEMYWFVALLVVNTLGILEILYLYVFAKPDSHPGGTPTPPPASK